MLIEAYAMRMSTDSAHEIATHICEVARDGVNIRPEELEPKKEEAVKDEQPAPAGAIPDQPPAYPGVLAHRSGCRERCAQQLGHCGALSHAVSVDRRDAEAMLSAILPILFDGGCDRLRLPTHFLRDPFDRECVPQAGCRSLCCRGLARGILGFIFSGACHG